MDANKASTTKTYIKFNIDIYSTIDQTNIGTARLSSSNNIGSATATTGNPCWNAFRGMAHNNPGPTPAPVVSTIGFGFELYSGVVPTDLNTYGRTSYNFVNPSTTNDMPANAFGGLNLYKEFMDPTIFQSNSDYTSTAANYGYEADLGAASTAPLPGYLVDSFMNTNANYGWSRSSVSPETAANWNGYQPLFLYSKTSGVNSALNYAGGVLIRGDFSITKAGLSISDSKIGLPTPVTFNATTAAQNNVSGIWGQYNGQLQTFWIRNLPCHYTSTCYVLCSISKPIFTPKCL